MREPASGDGGVYALIGADLGFWADSGASEESLDLRYAQQLLAKIYHMARGSRGLLFVRLAAGFCAAARRRQGMVTEPIVCLGFASDEGEQPMVIRWRLERAIPAVWLPRPSSPSLVVAVGTHRCAHPCGGTQPAAG